MNERIKQLMIQADYPAPELALRAHRLAELIVRECVGICEGKTDHLDPNMYEVWRGALACASDIKVHFGVEE